MPLWMITEEVVIGYDIFGRFPALSTLVDPVRIQYSGYRPFPEGESTINFDLVSIIGPLVFPIIFIFSLLVIMNVVVYEKENRLQEIVKIMGLRETVYWSAHFIFGLIIGAISVILFIIFAFAFDFRLITQTNGGVVFITFVLWTIVITVFSFFVTTFFSRLLTVDIAANIIIFASIIIAPAFLIDLVDATNEYAGPLNGLRLWVPFLIFRIFSSLGSNVQLGGKGINFMNPSSPHRRMNEIWLISVVDIVLYGVLFWYFENVLPKEFGVPKHPLFFLKVFGIDPEKNKKRLVVEAANQAVVSGKDTISEDSVSSLEGGDVKKHRDIALEEVATGTDISNTIYEIIVNGVHKFWHVAGDNPKHAVDSVSMVIKRGECFGLLGSNGAGKKDINFYFVWIISTNKWTVICKWS